MSNETEIRPFRVECPKKRSPTFGSVAAMRWPHHELVADRSQGVQLSTLQELTR
jgi:hypothetical protein